MMELKSSMDSTSDSMDDDSFRARVQKAFGSLSSSSSSSRTPWSLTDDQVEKREWNRGGGGAGYSTATRDDDATPCSSSFVGLFAKKDRKKKNPRVTDVRGNEPDGLDDDDEGGSERGGGGDGDDDEGDEWEIRSFVGKDRTLDFEEEEDEFDKVAEGRENAGDRLYMRDVTDHGPYLNSYNVLPNSPYETEILRDSRANHFAARIRLKEDEVEAQKISSYQMSDKSMSNVEEPYIKTQEDGGKLKSILKRKHDAVTSKEQKRVKFDPGCKDDMKVSSENPNDLVKGTPSVETTVSDDSSLLAKNTSGVPDYLLNPSKYTCYSFDSAREVDDSSNSQVCVDFLKLVKMSKPEETRSFSEDASSHLPKSITYIPRKNENTGARPKDSSSEVKQNQEDSSEQSLIQTGVPLGIAAGETQRSEVNVMEDELETNEADMTVGFQKTRRQYRTSLKSDDPVT